MSFKQKISRFSLDQTLFGRSIYKLPQLFGWTDYYTSWQDFKPVSKTIIFTGGTEKGDAKPSHKNVDANTSKTKRRKRWTRMMRKRLYRWLNAVRCEKRLKQKVNHKTSITKRRCENVTTEVQESIWNISFGLISLSKLI
jgi:hypothetical protein